MNIVRNSIIVTSLITLAGTANAGLLNFAEIANGETGESAWSTYTSTDSDGTLWVTAGNTANIDPAFVYLDRHTGGMGVCSSGVTSSGSATNSGANLCGNPVSAPGDDNVTVNEFLTLRFSEDVIIDTLWFNNFHDGDRSLLNDQITIGGDDYTFDNGNRSFRTWSSTLNPYTVAANTDFQIAYKNEEFYLHQILFSLDSSGPRNSVPTPATLALFSLGLAGLGWSRRKKA